MRCATLRWRWMRDSAGMSTRARPNRGALAGGAWVPCGLGAIVNWMSVMLYHVFEADFNLKRRLSRNSVI
eukprot:2418867-Prymnesium_polylepis.2